MRAGSRLLMSDTLGLVERGGGRVSARQSALKASQGDGATPPLGFFGHVHSIEYKVGVRLLRSLHPVSFSLRPRNTRPLKQIKAHRAFAERS